MFCPRCATENADDAKFCRGCGTDISLVPQAVTGQLAELSSEDEEGRSGRRNRKGRKPPTIERATKSFFEGLAFLLVSIAIALFFPSGRLWWFWLLIPAFYSMGNGVAIYLAVREKRKALTPPQFTPARGAVAPPKKQASELPSRDTGELVPPPPSVTEGTTRHLYVPAPRRSDMPEGK